MRRRPTNKIDLYGFTVKALLSPSPEGGGFFNFGRSREGSSGTSLIREEGLFTKLSNKDIFGNFSALIPHILRTQHTILRATYLTSNIFRWFCACVESRYTEK